MARLDELCVGLVGGAEQLRVDVLGAVLDELDDAGGIGEVALALEDAERPRAAREQVHPAVVEPLEHAVDLAGAADLAQAVLRQPDDPELLLVAQALVHHRLVALLEDVQRDQLAGHRDEPEREQRKVAGEPVRHHGGVYERCPLGRR